MSNFVRGGAGGPRQSAISQTQKTISAPVEKAMMPEATPLVPIVLNSNAEQGTPVGGLQDAASVATKLRGARIARHGDGADQNAFVTTALSMGAEGGMIPGQKSPAPPVPTAPPRLGNAEFATGPATMSGESAARGMAKLARTGGALGVTSVERQKSPGVPAPAPTFSSPNAEVPGGSPIPLPASGGTAYGIMQSGKGRPPAGNDIQ